MSEEFGSSRLICRPGGLQTGVRLIGYCQIPEPGLSLIPPQNQVSARFSHRIMARGKFRGKTSYGTQYHPKTVSPVQEYRCTTELAKPIGDINFSTTTSDLPFHKYG